MNAVDQHDVCAAHPGLPPCTWFGTWAPAQVYSLQPARPEPTVAAPRDSGGRREDGSGLVHVNFFGSGAGASALASAA